MVTSLWSEFSTQGEYNLGSPVLGIDVTSSFAEYGQNTFLQGQGLMLEGQRMPAVPTCFVLGLHEGSWLEPQRPLHGHLCPAHALLLTALVAQSLKPG